MRLLGIINVIFGLALLVLVSAGVFSNVLADIASWNQFESLAAKVVISTACVLALGSAAYLAFGRGERTQSR
jgi:hypothetical protein